MADSACKLFKIVENEILSECITMNFTRITTGPVFILRPILCVTFEKIKTETSDYGKVGNKCSK